MRDDLGTDCVAVSGELEQRAAQMPSASLTRSIHQGITVRAQPCIELPLGHSNFSGCDRGVVRQLAGECGGNEGCGAVVERVALRAKKAEGPPRVPQLPSRVVGIAVRAVLAQPVDIFVGGLDEESGHVFRRATPLFTIERPLAERPNHGSQPIKR